MKEPVIAQRKPRAVELVAGRQYYWCACGRSRNQPFCDGSHRGSGFEPLAFRAQTGGQALLCLCKHTANPPYCDGSHAKLSVQSPVAVPGVRATPEEPTLERIHRLARLGLSDTGPHGEMTAMGVPRTTLPQWDDIQILPAQLATRPLAEDAPVGSEVVIGPRAARPLVLRIPLLITDMSFGALSREAKLALARGAELAGTGICSGEGGMLPAEQAANSRYLYELAPAMFGYREELMSKVQAFHFKAGQAAKTGTGGHLPGAKVSAEVARLRGIAPGEDAVSPAAFAELKTVADFRAFAGRVRALSGGIPIGMKLSANHIEQDIDFALAAGVDYLILDGRGGGSGAAPRLFRDHISVPTIPALARARRHLERTGHHNITLIITGGLRLPEDFIKALALGADAIALGSAALQAIGCIAARICHSNLCPAGITTPDPELRARLDISDGSQRLQRFLDASTTLMKVMARACGHSHLGQFNCQDITSWKKEMADLAGIHFAGTAKT